MKWLFLILFGVVIMIGSSSTLLVAQEESVVSSGGSITLNDGSNFTKSEDNKNLIISKDNTTFNVTSSTPFYYVEDVKQTGEWGYQKSGNEIVKSNKDLVVRGNKICILNERLTFGLWNADCIVYSNLYNWSFYKINSKKVKVNWTGAVDPAFENVNITDFVAWYNLSHFVDTDNWEDLGTNGLDLDDGTTELINDNERCIGNPCLNFTGAGTAQQSYLFGNPITENWTMAVQLNSFSYPSTTFNWIFGGQSPSIITWNPSNSLRCAVEQTTGTQFPTLTLDAPYSLNTNITAICFKNGTNLCGQINNDSVSCTALDGDQLNSQFFGMGRSGKNLIGTYLSGAIAYDRVLNKSERQELYDCLRTRGDPRVGCQEVSGVDTTPPTYSNEQINWTSFFSTSAGQWNRTVSDDSAVAYCNVSINLTAGQTWVNFTNLTSPSKAQINFSTPSGWNVGDVFGIQAHCCDDIVPENCGADTEFTYTISAADTCSPTTPLPADHTFDANDNCIISSPFDAGGNNVECRDIGNGAGTLTVKAEVFNYEIWLTDRGCIDICEAGVVGC